MNQDSSLKCDGPLLRTLPFKHLTQMLATHGIPEVITSDNFPCGSSEFAAWCQQMGIKHRKITPLWPTANAQVERFNETLEKIIRISNVEGKNWCSELFVFLMNYQNTPHSSTGVSPASDDESPHQNQDRKEYMDKHHKATPSNICQGDQVLLLQKCANKLTTRYDPRPFTVVSKKGVSVELARGQARLFQNVSMVKKVSKATVNTGQPRNPSSEDHTPSYLNVRTQDTGHWEAFPRTAYSQLFK